MRRNSLRLLGSLMCPASPHRTRSKAQRWRYLTGDHLVRSLPHRYTALLVWPCLLGVSTEFPCTRSRTPPRLAGRSRCRRRAGVPLEPVPHEPRDPRRVQLPTNLIVEIATAARILPLRPLARAKISSLRRGETYRRCQTVPARQRRSLAIVVPVHGRRRPEPCR